jgi:uncharacterized protein (DUF302 family)
MTEPFMGESTDPQTVAELSHDAATIAEGPQTSCRTIAVDHIRIESVLSFDEVRDALDRLPRFDERIRALLHLGDAARVKAELEKLQGQAGLTLFSIATHGDWLQIRNGARKALQYVIGNVLISTQMTEREPAAGLYAPLRVMLFANPEGRAVLEYDRPSTLFGQYGDPRVTAVACDLDRKIHDVLIRAASARPNDERDR